MIERLPSRRRVVVLTSSYPSFPGDFSGHFVQTEVEQLARAGNEVWVLSPGPTRHPEVCGVRHWSLGGGTLFGSPGMLSRGRRNPTRWAQLVVTWAALRRAVAAIEESGPIDHLVAHWLVPGGWPWGWRVERLARVSGNLSWEVVVHGSDARLVARLPLPLKRWLLGSLARRGARLRYVSAHLRAMLLDGLSPELRAWAGAGRVCPAAIEVPIPASERIAAKRRQAGLAGRRAAGDKQAAENERSAGDERSTGEGRLLVVAGRLIPGKRIEVALSAAHLVPDAVTVVVGDGPERTRLERDHPHARFLGELPRSETLEWIAAADLLVSASKQEGASTVIREARLLETAVVATRGDDEGSVPPPSHGWKEAQPDGDLWWIGSEHAPALDQRRRGIS